MSKRTAINEPKSASQDEAMNDRSALLQSSPGTRAASRPGRGWR